MTATFSSWPAAALLRPLPCTVAPVHDEIADSYLGRLARANSMKPPELARCVKASTDISETVITLSGQPPASMRYAILELCSPRELAAMNITGRPRPGYSTRGGKCARCARTSDPVTCWKRSEDAICLRHQRWTVGNYQLDLAGHEDIIRAGRQHRQMIRQHGRAAAGPAFTRACRIIAEWASRGHYNHRFGQLIRRFHDRGQPVPFNDPAISVASYLPAVALTRLLVSPRWKALALHPAGNDKFVDEVRRTVEPTYKWDPSPRWRYVDPLVRALKRDARSPDRTLPRCGSYIPDPPAGPGEVF